MRAADVYSDTCFSLISFYEKTSFPNGDPEDL